MKVSSRRSVDIPPYPHLRRRNSIPNGTSFGGVSKIPTVRVSPALYETPEPSPLPDSPTPSYDASPFVINHKRRGPRLSKSFSEKNVMDVVAQADSVGPTRSSSYDYVVPVERSEVEEMRNGGAIQVVENNGRVTGETVPENGANKMAIGSSLERDSGGEVDDFFDPQESLSYSSSIDVEDHGGERSARSYNTPVGEFFDAWEELSFDSGRQTTPRPLVDVETELREMRLSLLTEIEKRKLIEETVNTMRCKWETLREELRAAGMSLPVDLEALGEIGHLDVTPIEDICQQIHLARCVSESIGKGLAKAEVEAEMEAELEKKNSEIAHLCDRLRYYETVNREMSQRNQEAIEIARHERLKRKRRQKWVWGSIAAALTLGTAALAWSYLPSGKGSSSTKYIEASESDRDMR